MIAAAAPSRVDRMLTLMASGSHGVREAIASTAVVDSSRIVPCAQCREQTRHQLKNATWQKGQSGAHACSS
jgi:hypothetical protein